MKPVAIVLLCGAVAAFAFLLYTLRNLERLGIGRGHPRVLVEAIPGLAGLATGLALWFGSR
jgi:hypothetical protein